MSHPLTPRPTLALTLAVLICGAAPAFAQQPGQKAGVAAAVAGSVLLADRPGAVGREVGSGAPIYQGNEIRTGAGGRLQIMLLDETIFTIGPNSSMVIDKFVYDPTNGGELAAKVTQGVFRFVSGRIAKKDPKQMKVDLPSATIGIRGTSAAGRVDGASASVVLLGPGANNNAGERAGRVIVGNAAGTVDLRAPRFGTTVAGPSAPPSPPALWTQARLDALTRTLASVPRASAGSAPADPAGGDDAGGRADDAEGDDQKTDDRGRARGEKRRDEEKPRRGAREPGQEGDGDGLAEGEPPPPGDGSGALPPPPPPPGEDADGTYATFDGGGDDGGLLDDPMAGGEPLPGDYTEPTPTSLAGQDDATHIDYIDTTLIDPTIQLPPPDEIPSGPGTPLISEFTSFDQLRSIPSGVAEYKALNVPLSGPGVGQYNLNIKINFGTREIKLDRFDGGYRFDGSVARGFSDPMVGSSIHDYTNDTGLANNFSDQPGDAIVQPNGDIVRLFVELLNDGSIIAGKGRAGVVVEEASSDRRLGGDVVVPRKDIAP